MNINLLDINFKKDLIKNLKYTLNNGLYKSMIPKNFLNLIKFDKNFEEKMFTPNDSLCNVKVLSKVDPLKILELVSVKGTNNFCNNTHNPIIILSVESDYDGTSTNEFNSEIKYESLSLRTNFFNTTNLYKSNFPLKSYFCLYSDSTYVCVPKVLKDPKVIQFLHLDEIFKSPIMLYSDMTNFNEIQIMSTFECLFQTCIIKNHKFIIFSMDGLVKNNFIDNSKIKLFITIINYCILKYGHLFNNIVFCFNNFKNEIFEEFHNENGIIRPVKLCEKISQRDINDLDNLI